MPPNKHKPDAPKVDVLRPVRRLPNGRAKTWLLRILTRGETATSRDLDGPAARAAAGRQRKRI
jgi:hypothetical protein